MKFNFFFFLFFISFLPVHSQTSINSDNCDPESKEYKARFEKLNDLYVKMLTSQESIDYVKKLNAFMAKFYSPEYFKAFKDSGFKSGFSKQWIAENLDKTKFKSYKEAEDMRKSNSEAYEIVLLQNKELYDYVDEIMEVCEEMINKLYIQLMDYFGDRFHA
ncbi:hypothetical protein [Flavobacterium sp. NRK1]|uniref:hypothetical protein n=1 Tax=Flavobacterium sp. NRK1 TaxID=2954929 RepID=UPI0020938EEF|nr:hypothetical protein [Flavobacterium sp. NRK1]MCO6148702.1 hypothetical protein [Flavobacterium sp. NRK1]